MPSKNALSYKLAHVRAPTFEKQRPMARAGPDFAGMRVQKEAGMECQVCGNEYEKPLVITLADETYVFDCFECAIHELAPTCAHCGCRVIGHGVDAGAAGAVYCCSHCADMMHAAQA